MKVLKNRFSLMVRLGISAMALLLSQQVFALGTLANTDVDNTATVSWSVGGNAQTPFDAVAPTFVVDRRVDFTVTPDGVSEVVNPGDAVTFDFDIASTGNSELDFVITVDNLIAGPPTINGFDDTGADVTFLPAQLDIYVDNVAVDAGTPTTFTVTGAAALALANADVANISVTVTAYDPAGDTGNRITLDNTDADPDSNTLDNVFANLSGGGVELSYDGIYVESATLAITKLNVTYWDPINNLTNPKAIPGSVVEYTIAIANTGAVPATGIVISDPVLAPAVFLDAANNPIAAAEPYGTGNVQFFDGTTTTTCLAESGGVDTNTDGCVLTGTTLTINPAAATPAYSIDVPATTGTMDISFQVLVP